MSNDIFSDTFTNVPISHIIESTPTPKLKNHWAARFLVWSIVYAAIMLFIVGPLVR